MKASVQYIALLLLCRCLIVAQTITLSVSGVSNGGGFATGPTMGMQSSAGVAAIDSVGSNGGSFSMLGGFVAVQSVFAGTTFTGALNLEAGWNLASVPALQSDYRTTTLFPTAISRAYSYQGQYTPCDTLRNGVGYWVKYPVDTTVSFQGAGIVSDTVAVAHNWNLLGGVSHPVLAADVTPVPPTTVTTQFYGFRNGTGYFTADTLIPGKAYWVKVQNAGHIIIRAASGSTIIDSPRRTIRQMMEEEFSRLQIMDSIGQSRTLYFANSFTETNPKILELPPAAPGELLDVRYATGSMLAVPDEQKSSETAVQISSARYPLTVQWRNVPLHANASLLLDDKEVKVGGEGNVVINNSPTRLALRLKGSVANELPHEFALGQNYPNPFNPSTVIRYQLPAAAVVTLKIYNMLGQEVVTLADGMEDAGYKSVTWNAGTIASGVYFYRLQAPGFDQTKKLMVLR